MAYEESTYKYRGNWSAQLRDMVAVQQRNEAQAALQREEHATQTAKRLAELGQLGLRLLDDKGSPLSEFGRAAHSLGVADLLASGYSQTPIRHISPLKRQLSARVRRESSSLGRASSSLRMGAHGERLAPKTMATGVDHGVDSARGFIAQAGARRDNRWL